MKKQVSGGRLPKRIREELERTARPTALSEVAAALEDAIEARESGKLALALKHATKAKDGAPRSPSVREVLGLLLFQQSKWHEASQELLAYRRLRGDKRRDPVIAACFRELALPERSLEFLSELKPNDVPQDTFIAAQVERARAYSAVGRASLGLEVLRTARRTATGARAKRIDEAIAELAG